MNKAATSSLSRTSVKGHWSGYDLLQAQREGDEEVKSSVGNPTLATPGQQPQAPPSHGIFQ